MAKSPEYDAMSIDELKAIQSAVQAALDAKIEARRAELMQELALLGGSPVKPAAKPKADGDARAAVKPMYRSKANPSVTWSGRGARAKWLTAEMEESGLPIEAFKITE
jgi:DNA-binding protein H-NS